MFLRMENPDDYYKIKEEKEIDFTKSIEYDNKQFIDIIFPKYKSMVEIFRNNIWLAEKDTQLFFNTLIEFVDIWERSLKNAVLGEVFQQIENREENLSFL